LFNKDKYVLLTTVHYTALILITNESFIIFIT